MKIKTKIIATVATTVLSIVAINNKIFKNAEKQLEKENDLILSSHIYNWKFGKISYKTIGNGSPVLLVHSPIIGSSGNEWKENISDLSKNHKLYIIDLLGFGNSERADITYSSYLYVCLVNDFITEVIKQPSAIVASNLSAAIAEMAYVFNPKNFTKLCLVCPPTDTPKNNFSEILKKLPLDFPVFGDLMFNFFNSKKMLKKHLRKNVYSNNFEISADKINSMYAYSHKDGANNRHIFHAFITNKLNLNIETALPETDLPVLIIYGNCFPNVQKNISTILTLNPNVKTEIINGKSLPNEEDPKTFNKLCLNFFK